MCATLAVASDGLQADRVNPRGADPNVETRILREYLEMPGVC